MSALFSFSNSFILFSCTVFYNRVKVEYAVRNQQVSFFLLLSPFVEIVLLRIFIRIPQTHFPHRGMIITAYLRFSNRTWIERFCAYPENTYFCEIDEEYIRDAFNLYGLDSECKYYKQAISIMIDSECSSSDSSSGKR